MECVDYICFVFKYDSNAVIPNLMTILEILNLTIQACTKIDVGFSDFIEEANIIFGVGTSMEKFLHALVEELFLFRRLSIIPITCVMPSSMVVDS